MAHFKKFDPSEKARIWWALMYTENMRDDWQENISEIVQHPFAYCIHNQDKNYSDGTPRKEHVHVMLVWGNPTTGKAALKVFMKLAKDGCNPLPNNEIEAVTWVSWAYNYLIHDTVEAKKAGKFVYDPSERITGNNFDIGNFEQISKTEEQSFLDRFADYILDNGISNFAWFYRWVKSDPEFSGCRSVVMQVLEKKSGFLERLIKGVYLEQRAAIQEEKDRRFFDSQESRSRHYDKRDRDV